MTWSSLVQCSGMRRRAWARAFEAFSARILASA
eukprot:CAMPEP_0181530608 /NCGR_PEP_ID=MMETSP1110-20121109/71680_1 /TAXON_ID=174948 /ORGANISM="Symbiodinium sp., Strain CCMP421" /LENGTH=32 /DNA_ID= /DNA_START= /DNA_END= /DNA_ORIENTATION=